MTRFAWLVSLFLLGFGAACTGGGGGGNTQGAGGGGGSPGGAGGNGKTGGSGGHAPGSGVTVLVRDDRGQPIGNGFRWLLEEDNTTAAVPGVRSPSAPLGSVPGDPSFTLGVSIHHSHAPTVCAGDTAPANTTDTFPAATVTPAGPAASQVVLNAQSCPGFDPTKRYIVSVLPWHTSPGGAAPFAQTGFTMSGRNIAPGQAQVTVVVHAFPVPTGQITVLVFNDNQPLNAAYDQPAESGLPGFTLILTDPIGKVMQDAFGNPLGTTYKYACAMPDGRPAQGTQNPDGSVTCASPPVALLPEQQPIYQRDPASGLPVVDYLGDGNLLTCPGPAKAPADYTPYEKANCYDPYTLQPLSAGEAVVRYLPGNKYTLEPVPPQNDPDWILTGTLEGTRGNDAWVRATEPRYNITLGQLNWLAFFGFVKPENNLASVPNPSHAATATVSGQIVYAHDMHPPRQAGLSPGLPVPNAYVAVNNLNGNDEAIYTAPADPATGAFSISGLVPGTYQLAFFDKPVNAIIDYRTIQVSAGQTLALGPVSVYGWFGNITGSVFNDTNQNGFMDPGETGIPSLPVNLHYTDGSLYGSTQTDSNGQYVFPETTAWWRYVIADVDISRFKPTGVTAYVDNGGPLPASALGRQGINPQLQPDGSDHRTQRPTSDDWAVTQAVQTFQDMNNRLDWGKAAWGPNETGGIHGMINYAITRTEEDPAQSTIDPWEPGVPRVKVTLHQAKKDLVNGDPLADHWVVADTGPFPLTTTSDSWDDNRPEGCVGSAGAADQGPVLWPNPELVNGIAIPSCAETFYNWDQVRPGVMDGTYAFRSMPDGSPIPPGDYIVEVTPPPGYQVIAWADRDIDVGDPKIPFLTQPPPCVGASYDVAPYLRWFPDQQNQTLFPGAWQNGQWTHPRAAACDRKYVPLNPSANANVDFNIFTWVPKAARIWGTVWNDLMLEFDPKSPNASGNFGIPWLPVSVKDWSGTEVARFYTDQWGHFDGLVPASYDIAPPIPLGLTLAMYTIAPNDPGPILDTRAGSPTQGQYITDPWFNPTYSQEVIRENWEFYSGKTTFIDTIVLPVGGFAGNRVPLNCDFQDGTPEIKQVSDVVIPQTAGGYTITLTSVGTVTDPNPLYDPGNAQSAPTVTYDHSFGTGGTVSVGGTPLPASNVVWAVDGTSIKATIPNGVSGQLTVTRADTGRSSMVGVTLHAASPNVPVVEVNPPAPGCTGVACGVIQPAVDAAPPGALLVLKPGTYQENVNLWKPLTLQGMGAGATVLDGTAAMANFALKQQQFNQLLSLTASGAVGIVPNQASDFTLEEGAGILVGGCGNTPSCGPAGGPNTSFFAPGAQAQIDGIKITGATEAGGAVLVNGYVANLRITNTDLWLNQGSIGGAIRAGESALVGPNNPEGSSFNPNLVIDHNHIAQNGSLFSGGGGIALYAGSDNYVVSNNLICGNFSAGYGGGIGHYGLSRNGQIVSNLIVSNESMDEGGGIHIGGELPSSSSGLTPGAGSVLVKSNLIQGNKGGDDGGGLRTRRVNGLDVAQNPADPTRWWQLLVYDNLIVDNSSADTGGGVALDDTVRSQIVGTTVARNDSTATSSDSFGPCTENSPLGQVCPGTEPLGGLTTSTPAVAGIASIGHSSALFAALTAPGSYCAANPADALCAPYSNPGLVDDIIWQNRSFYWDASANSGLGALVPSPRAIWDLGVYPSDPNALTTPPPGSQVMSPVYTLLTDGVGAAPSSTNLVGADPLFIAPYFNTYQATSKGATLGEYVATMFTPNGLVGNYGLAPGSPALGAGSAIPPGTPTDYFGAKRTAPVTLGAIQAPSTPAPRKPASFTTAHRESP